MELTRAAISKHATAFCRANDLEPSLYMKPDQAADAYADARLESIAEENERTLPPVPREAVEYDERERAGQPTGTLLPTRPCDV